MNEKLPNVGNLVKILKHGYCNDIGKEAEIVEVRRGKNSAIRVQVNGRFYWLPILRGEIAMGKFKHFELYPF